MLSKLIILIMWNLISASKITQKRIKRKNYQNHMEKLIQMRPRTIIKEPSQPEFVYSKPKQAQTRRQKEEEIERNNRILVVKMEGISKAKYTQNALRPQAQWLKTLNQQLLPNQIDAIVKENARICNKLLTVQSHYPTNTIMDSSQRLQRVRANISENARRVQSAHHLQTQASLTRSSRFYRSQVGRYDQEGKLINTEQDESRRAAMRPESAPGHKNYWSGRGSSMENEQVEDK